MAPRWLVRLLERVLPPDQHDDAVGDLEELHRRRLGRRGALLATIITVADGTGIILSQWVRSLAGSLTGGNRWVSWMEVRLAARLIRRQPIMTLTAVVALGTGIGMAAGGISVFRQGLYGDLPFENADRWVGMSVYGAESGGRRPMDLERLRLLRSSAPALAYVAGTESVDFNVVHQTGEVEPVAGARVTPGVFAYLPYVPVTGRLLVPEDGALGAAPVALVRESLWTRRFSRSPDIIGSTLDIAGQPHQIVGVLPDDAGYPSKGEIWVPMVEETMGAADDRSPVGSRFIAVLADGATLEQAASQVGQLSRGVSSAGRGGEALRYQLTPLNRVNVTPQIQVMIFVFIAVLVSVLLIIAANVANLIVARTSRRSAELAVRTALGASRSRIVGQLFVEVLLIGIIAAIPGLLLAGGILSVYDRVLDELPFWVHIHLDASTAVTVVAATLLASGVMGVVPALRATRRDTADSLRATGTSRALGIGRIGGAMIVAQVALSVALLGTAVVFAQGFQSYLDPAFHLPDDRVLTARFLLDATESDLAEGGAATVEDSMRITVRAIQQATSTLPGVQAVGVASHLPRTSPYPEAVEIEEGEGSALTPMVALGPGVFDVLEVQPVLGRSVEEEDLLPGAPLIAVVNEAFAIERFGTIQVLGRRLRVLEDAQGDEPAPWRTIVGVAPNVMEVTGSTGAAGIYVPFTTRRFFSLALRVNADPMALTGSLRRAIFDLDPDLNVSQIVRLDEVGAENRTPLAVMSSALTGIGAITLLLSLAGVYSIVSLSVTQRTREIGVRLALGAEPQGILWSVLRRSVTLILGGALIGAVIGFRAGKIRLFVFAVPDPAPWLYPSLVVLMGVVSVLACWIPARRALTIQPVEAIRQE